MPNLTPNNNSSNSNVPLNPLNLRRRRRGNKLRVIIILLFIAIVLGADIVSRLHHETGVPSMNLTGQTALPTDSTAFSQVLFVSCNRHDREQTYWGAVARAAQCEAAPLAVRQTAETCQQLYRGEATTDDTRCGAVLRYPTHPLSAVPLVNPDPTASVTAVSPLDAMAWMGDAIYADKPIETGEKRSALQLGHTENPLPVVKDMWVTQRRSPQYSQFRETCIRPRPDLTPEEEEEVRILKKKRRESSESQKQQDNFFDAHVATDYVSVYGMWDDHDMGINDGGKDYPNKDTTQRFLLNFLGAPEKDERWRRPGVYAFHTVPFKDIPDDQLHTLFQTEEEKVFRLAQEVYENAFCLILLDVRSFRDTPNASFSGDVLGDAQWLWLEELLEHNITKKGQVGEKKQTCAVTLIASGTQFMMDVLPSENWAEFPLARDRLLSTLRRHELEHAVFLTGDIHMGEISADFTSTAFQALGYPMVEVTSSGLTHSAGDFGEVSRIVKHIFHSPRRLALYMHKNFGLSKLTVGGDSTAVRRAVEAYDRFLSPTATEAVTESVREHLHELVDAAVNVSFTIHSIARNGQPVIRTHFPLEMLSYKKGALYKDASVPQAGTRGEVQKAVAPVKQNEKHLEKLVYTDAYGKQQEMLHYPCASHPRVTYTIRLLQKIWFRDRSIPKTITSTIRLMVHAIIIASLGWFLWWVFTMRRRARNRRRGSFSNLQNIKSGPSTPMMTSVTVETSSQQLTRVSTPSKTKKR